MSNLIKLRHTKGLYIDQAKYFLEDGKGGRVLVKVNYKENFYRLRSISKSNGSLGDLKKDAARFAEDLLLRKAKKNIVEKRE